MELDDHLPEENPLEEPPRVWPPGWSVLHVTETGSTNADLLVAAAAGAPDRSVLVADHQTDGRGRLDRRWEAPPGANLLVSILQRDVPADAGEVVRRVGIATVDAVRSVAGVDARLKWPNDVVIEGAKLGGILAQRSADGSVVVGLGLNVGWAPPGAARLGEPYRPLDVLNGILEALDAQPDDVYDRYAELLDTLGRRVRVSMPNDELTGTATGVERGGRLIVLDDCAVTHRIDVGDIVHLRRDD